MVVKGYQRHLVKVQLAKGHLIKLFRLCVYIFQSECIICLFVVQKIFFFFFFGLVFLFVWYFLEVIKDVFCKSFIPGKNSKKLLKKKKLPWHCMANYLKKKRNLPWHCSFQQSNLTLLTWRCSGLLCWLGLFLGAVRASSSYQPPVSPSHASALTTWGRSSGSMSAHRLCKTGSSGSYPYACKCVKCSLEQ